MPDKPNKRLTKPIRLGLIGCGGIVQKSHCPSYLNIPDFVKVVALADLVPENLQFQHRGVSRQLKGCAGGRCILQTDPSG